MYIFSPWTSIDGPWFLYFCFRQNKNQKNQANLVTFTDYYQSIRCKNIFDKREGIFPYILRLDIVLIIQVSFYLMLGKSLDQQSKIHGNYTWFPLLPSNIFSKRKRCWGTFLKQKYSRNDWSIFSELPTIYQNRKIYVFFQFCFRNIWYNLLLKVVMGFTAFAVQYIGKVMESQLCAEEHCKIFGSGSQY